MSGTIVDRLEGKRRIHVDSMALIYFIEESPTYGPIVRRVIEFIQTNDLEAISSYITLLEVMVQPLKNGRTDLAHKYRDILLNADRFSLIPVDRLISENGAEIRARFNFKTPDAIQLSTARSLGADTFITNDIELKRFDQLEILLLDDFLPQEENIEGEGK